jgi:hypothetical protein
MFNNAALDVFIGLLAIFLLYSLLASILMEILAKRIGLRQENTLKAISKLLDDSDYDNPWRISLEKKKLTGLFYAHPNIRNLGDNMMNKKPSAITPEMFADTLIQLLRGDKFSGTENQIKMIKDNLSLDDDTKKGKLPLPRWYHQSTFNPLKLTKVAENQPTGTIDLDELTFYQLEQFIIDAGSDIDVFRKKLITWYNEMMDRAEGWYIKKTRGWLFVIGLLIAGLFNVDAIVIGQQLAHDKTMRDNMVNFASHLQKDEILKNAVKGGQQAQQALETTFKEVNDSYTDSKNILGEGLGRSKTFCIGWLITAFAISLGAPFWFDLLGKLMCIRQGGNSSSTDQQKKLAAASGNGEEAIG